MTITGFSVLFYFLLNGLWMKSDIPVDRPINVYDKDYFIFPISPGSQASLSGTFGDIRINHFHAGLDIRTGGREGKSVFAAASGYVSRIKVAHGGYGNALYITHDNGLTTVYGHLKEYNEVIKKYLVANQYQFQTFEIDLFLKPDELPVSKGELVAFSGNTGGSGGPHLHFEIRDKEENTLDPSMLGFNEIKDNVAPVIEFVSLKCLSADARVNGEFGSFDFDVSMSKDGEYFINQNIEVWGEVGLEIYTYDKSNTSPFRLGVKSIELKKDKSTEYKFELDKLAFHNKIDMNLHANYERMVNENNKLHKAYVEEGNSMNLYYTNDKKGRLIFRDKKAHQINVILKDTYQNSRSLNFEIRSNETNNSPIKNFLKSNENNAVSISGPFVKIVRRTTNQKLKLLDGNFATEIEPSYSNNLEETYIIDLNEIYFSKFMDGHQLYNAPFTDEISNRFSIIAKKDYELDLKNALYSQLYVNFTTDNNVLKLGKDIHPLKGNFEVKWRSTQSNIDSNKDAVYLVDGRSPKYTGGDWSGSTVTFNPKEFGTYQVLRDSEKPNIIARTVNSSSLIFSIKDGLSGIKSFECFVNGEWVLMEYEYKNGLLWAEKLSNKPFEGEVLLRVKDNCNNEEIYKRTI
jgi:hypothetical protein